MPILRKETDVFPEDVFELPLSEAPWEVVHVRSRHEKAVARTLFDERKPFYLPQIMQMVTRAGRTFTSHLPMFPGYLFVRRTAGTRDTLRRTGAVAAIIEVPDQAQIAVELRQIRNLAARGALFTPSDEIVCGDTVRVSDGAFHGYVGVVAEERGSMRLLVTVSILRKQIAVEFPRELLLPERTSAPRKPSADRASGMR